MSLSTYADLKTAIGSWTHRGDMASISSDLIALAESRINGDIDARMQDTETTLSTVIAQDYVSLPSDLINIRSVYLDDSQNIVLKYVAPDMFRTLYQYDSAGKPTVYTVIGSKMVMNPVPDAVYSLKLTYKARVPALSDANTTNWLLTTYPHVYLFAALCECAPYIKDDSRIPMWDAKYKESIQTVNSQDWYSGSTMQVRTDIRP